MRAQLQVDVQVAGLCLAAEVFTQLREQRRQRQCAGCELECTGLDLGNVEVLLYQGLSMLQCAADALADGLQRCMAQLVGMQPYRIAIPAQHAQRLTQVVAGSSEEAGLGQHRHLGALAFIVGAAALGLGALALGLCAQALGVHPVDFLAQLLKGKAVAAHVEHQQAEQQRQQHGDPTPFEIVVAEPSAYQYTAKWQHPGGIGLHQPGSRAQAACGRADGHERDQEMHLAVVGTKADHDRPSPHHTQHEEPQVDPTHVGGRRCRLASHHALHIERPADLQHAAECNPDQNPGRDTRPHQQPGKKHIDQRHHKWAAAQLVPHQLQL